MNFECSSLVNIIFLVDMIEIQSELFNMGDSRIDKATRGQKVYPNYCYTTIITLNF